jgi:hypothetical protein
MYSHQFIWLRSNTSGVVGVNPDDMTAYITEYNKSFVRKYLSFWEWLECEKDIAAHGFDYLWNEGNPHICKLPTIKNELQGGM